MPAKISAELIINTLKNAIRWKNNNTIKANKLALNVFIDYLKLRFLPKNNNSANAFNNFLSHPLDAKAEGKLETWIEIALEENRALLGDLSEKIEKVESFYKKNVLGESMDDTLEQEKVELVEDSSEKETSGTVAQHDFSDDDDDDHMASVDRPIIVPWDFSTVAEYALDHAVQFSKTAGEKVFMLHITRSDKEIPQAKTSMEKIAESTFQKTGIRPDVMVQVGNIFKTITEIANENHAKFVIMGTHGIKGIQKFTGSLALKVIAGTNTPFIVVQESPTVSAIRNVVFPVDHTKENKQKLKQAMLLARYYKVKYFLTMPEKITSDHTKRNLKTNLNYVKSYFAHHGIEYEVAKVPGTDSFSDATLKYAADHKPDMIIVLTTKNINIQDYVLGADEQKIIANSSKIPVMCINPMKVKFASMSVHGVA